MWMVDAEDVAWIAPLAGMAMIAAVTWAVFWFLVKRAQYQSRPDHDFRRLAEEAVKSQQVVAHETQKLAEAVKEIQQLLAKV
jgi:hypothetical protein